MFPCQKSKLFTEWKMGVNADISVKVYLKISLIFELTLTLGNGEEEVWANSK